MFKKTASFLIFITKRSLQVYRFTTEESAIYEFDPQTFKHSEILDSELFETKLEEFITNLQILKQEAVIALSDSLVFYKEFEFPTNDKEDAKSSAIESKVDEKELNYFYDLIPLEESHKVMKTVTTQTSQVAFVTNRTLFETVIKLFNKVNWQINSVVPSVFFNITKEDQLTHEEIDTILTNTAVLEQANFLQGINPTASKPEKNLEDEPEEEKPTQTKHTKLALILIIGVLTAVGIGTFWYLSEQSKPKKRPTPIQTQAVQPTPTASASAALAPSPTSSASAQPTAAKDQLTINILNGSGVAGQAAKLRDALESLGYSQVEVGNSSTTQSSTTLTTTSQVTDPVRNEIKSELEKLFQTIDTTISTQSAEYDIQITTGRLKEG